MKSRTEIFEELHSLSPAVAEISNLNVFTVPEGYFDSLPGEILSGVILERLELKDRATVQNDVPAHYFDGLAANIMGRIKAEEANAAPMAETYAISPIVAQIGNENIFTVPPAYFENVGDYILDSIPKPAEVVAMRSRSWIKYAAAASVAGIMAIGAYNYQSQNTNTAPIAVNTAAINQTADSILKHNAFEATLDNISNEEIEQYLLAQGTDVQAALVATATENDDLPSELDYLVEESTLNDYLKQLNIDNSN